MVLTKNVVIDGRTAANNIMRASLVRRASGGVLVLRETYIRTAQGRIQHPLDTALTDAAIFTQCNRQIISCFPWIFTVEITYVAIFSIFCDRREQKIEKICDFEEKFDDFDVLETNFTKIGL